MYCVKDEDYLVKDVSEPENVSHSKWREYIYNNWNKKGVRILEIGSREVTGKSEARARFCEAEYVGFDYYDGDNVDVIGDVHKLSSYFGEGEQFDLIFSSACFEHFAMPWVASAEIAKLLKVGGHVFVETHFSFTTHERPWNFFQFSDMALQVLFPPALGFECIESGMSNPIVGRFSSFADDYLKNQPVLGLYCHSEFLGKKVERVDDFKWETLGLNDVVGEMEYPKSDVMKYLLDNQACESISNFVRSKNRVYIYGAGRHGNDCYNILKELKLDIEAYIVSSREAANGELNNKRIHCIDDIKLENLDGVIVAVGMKFREEILGNIDKVLKVESYIFEPII